MKAGSWGLCFALLLCLPASRAEPPKRSEKLPSAETGASAPINSKRLVRPSSMKRLMRLCFGETPAIPPSPNETLETQKQELRKQAEKRARKAPRLKKTVRATAGKKVVAKYCGTEPKPSAEVTARVQRIAVRLNKVVPKPVLRERQFPAVFQVSSNEGVNAFMAPAGRGCVLEGLVESAPNDDALAFVLGHEIAHHLLGHLDIRLRDELYWQEELRRIEVEQNLRAQRAALKLLRDLGASYSDILTLTRLVRDLEKMLKPVRDWVRQLSSRVLANILMMPYDQDQEYEADRLGVCLVKLAHYDTRGAEDFFKSLAGGDSTVADSEGDYWSAALDALVQSHPYPQQRALYMGRLRSLMSKP